MLQANTGSCQPSGLSCRSSKSISMYAVKSAHCSPRYTVIGIRIVLVVYCYNFFTGRGSSAVIVENDKLFYC